MSKAVLDVVGAALGLLVLWPVLVAMAIWIRIDSPGPVFFRQERVGRSGRIFRIHKFRTMVENAERMGGQITVGSDSRITRCGAFLRRTKLDELPQLIDVLLGHMSLVGPRPEVPKYVKLYPEDVRRTVLSVKPGITDPASIQYRNESALLAESADPELTYVRDILPVKLASYRHYVETRSLWGDVKIIFRTLAAITR